MNRQSAQPLESHIPDLIADLSHPDDLRRQRARLLLVHMGQTSLPALLGALKSDYTLTRWEAVKALGQIGDPSAAAAVCLRLMDEDVGTRWAAMESLIQFGREALRPLLELFVKNFDSPWLREGVRHVLHVLKDRHQLNELEIQLFEALSKQNIFGFVTGWTSDQVWTAEKALETIDLETDRLESRQ